MCYQDGDFLLGPHDLLRSEIAGCPYYMDAEMFERWGRPRLLIGSATGGSDSFSLEGSLDMHFITRAQSFVVPRCAQDKERSLRDEH